MSGARLERSARDRVLLGVCGGLARTLGVDAALVRLAFIALVLLGGAGLVLYAGLALLMATPAEPLRPWREHRQETIGVAALMAAASAGLAVRDLLIPLDVLVPAALLAGGVALVWRQVVAGRAGGERPALREIARLGGGLALVGFGAILFLSASGNLAQIGRAHV